MVYIFAALAALSAASALFLLFKLISLRQSAIELRTQLAERMRTDTNVGIDITASDKQMRQLAADLDRQLKLLRKKQIQYTRGDQELKTAVTNISHDLRTPLTAVYGYLDLLKQEEMSDTARKYLAIIRSRTEALRTLSEELFRYSVILSVDSCVKQEVLSLQAVLEECMAQYYGAFVEAGIKPDITLSDHAVIRMLNRQSLARIISNIISNALKYSDGDFCVHLDNEGTMHFSNHSAKLDPVTAGHLFDRFYTVETGHRSTGLGLSIARTLTEEMHGKIDAEYQDGRLLIHVFFPDTGAASETGRQVPQKPEKTSREF